MKTPLRSGLPWLTAHIMVAANAAAIAQVFEVEDGAVYQPGAQVAGPCETNGPVPQNISCNDSGRQFFVATKVTTSGWDASVSPPACAPVTLPPLPGRYRALIIETSNEWVADKCYENIGKIYLAENKTSDWKTLEFTVAEAEDDCPAANDAWRDRIEDEAATYREALSDNVSRRPAIRQLRRDAEERDGITGRAARSQADDIDEGLDDLAYDCDRIAYGLADACDSISVCGEDIAEAIAEGPGSFCRAVHEIAIASIPAGANSASQAYSMFRQNLPCLSQLYDQGDFEDLVDATRMARQPHAGLPAK